jgi:hypothetical protein
MLSDATIAPDPVRLTAVEQGWISLTGTGPMLTAAQRHAIIDAARAAWEGAGAPDVTLGPAGEAAYWMAVDAGGVTAAVVSDLEARGLDRFSYLEIVGIVARLSNIDFYVTGLGGSRPSLPDPDPSAPTGAVAAGASLVDMWVPQAGPVRAPMVLDALPGEGNAFRAIHEPMYIPFHEIGNGAYSDVLTRPQLEYVAARASYLNECFY